MRLHITAQSLPILTNEDEKYGCAVPEYKKIKIKHRELFWQHSWFHSRFVYICSKVSVEKEEALSRDSTAIVNSFFFAKISGTIRKKKRIFGRFYFRMTVASSYPGGGDDPNVIKIG